MSKVERFGNLEVARDLQSRTSSEKPKTSTAEERARILASDLRLPAGAVPGAARKGGFEAPPPRSSRATDAPIPGSEEATGVLVQMLSGCGSSEELMEMTPNELIQALAQRYPEQSELYSGLSPSDLDALIGELEEMDSCSRKHIERAAKELARGDIDDAEREIKKALRQMNGGKQLSREERKKLVGAWLKKLAPYAELAKLSSDDIANKLRAGYPGAAPVLDDMSPEEMLQILGRLDVENNPAAKRHLARAVEEMAKGDRGDAECELKKAMNAMGVLDESQVQKLVKRAKEKLRCGDFDGALALLARAGRGGVVGSDMADSEKDLNGALAEMGR